MKLLDIIAMVVEFTCWVFLCGAGIYSIVAEDSVVCMLIILFSAIAAGVFGVIHLLDVIKENK